MGLWAEESGSVVGSVLESFAIALGLGFFYLQSSPSQLLSVKFAAFFAVGFAVAGIGLCLEKRWGAIMPLALEALGLVALLVFTRWSALWFLAGAPLVIVPGLTALEHLS